MALRHIRDEAGVLRLGGDVVPGRQDSRRHTRAAPGDGREQDQPVDAVGLGDGGARRRHRPPGMRHQRRTRLAGLPAHQGQHRGDLFGGFRGAAKRRMAIGGLGHVGIAATFTETREVEGPGVEAARVEIVEPRTAAEIEADGQCRGKGGAMDVENRRAARQRLTTDEER